MDCSQYIHDYHKVTHTLHIHNKDALACFASTYGVASTYDVGDEGDKGDEGDEDDEGEHVTDNSAIPFLQKYNWCKKYCKYFLSHCKGLQHFNYFQLSIPST